MFGLELEGKKLVATFPNDLDDSFTDEIIHFKLHIERSIKIIGDLKEAPTNIIEICSYMQEKRINYKLYEYVVFPSSDVAL